MDRPAAIPRASLCALLAFAYGLLLPAGAQGTGPMVPERTCMTGLGRSMRPTLPDFCRMVVARIPFDAVKAGPLDGDIVATRLNGIAVAHRAIGRQPDGSLVTQGDNNRRPDPDATTERNYVGIVIGFENPGTVGELLVPGPRF